MNKIEREAKLAKMRRLYDKQGWTLEEIGEYYGITRQAVHDRFKRAGIKIRSAVRQKQRIPAIDREKLIEIYETDPRPLAEISDTLKVSLYKINQELDRHGIKKRPKGLMRVTSWLRELKIGECRTIEKPAQVKNVYRNMHGKAHSISIIISVKKVNENAFQVIRLK